VHFSLPEILNLGSVVLGVVQLQVVLASPNTSAYHPFVAFAIDKDD
jgi:hypothetical protein